jgi:outer membrane protein OmpA-like peptidoglycan-associated protein
MNRSKKLNGIFLGIGMLAIFTIFIFSGCATKKYVAEQIAPVADRVTNTENRIGQTEGQIAKLGERATADEGKITKIEGDLSKVDAKADRALAAFGNLKFERRVSLATDMKEGANFGFNSTTLSNEAKQKIDEFFNSLKGTTAGAENTVFLVAGHTDNKGTDDINYELGRKRADMVTRYLVTQKKIDPLHIVTASYGETVPVAENNTREGRTKNRRVEILAYSEAIASVSGMPK